jgi:hypothetical protein
VFRRGGTATAGFVVNLEAVEGGVDGRPSSSVVEVTRHFERVQRYCIR